MQNLALLASLLAGPCLAAPSGVPLPEGPVELGRVAWRRDHDAAFAEAREAERPVLLLFQEIPG